MDLKDEVFKPFCQIPIPERWFLIFDEPLQSVDTIILSIIFLDSIDTVQFIKLFYVISCMLIGDLECCYHLIWIGFTHFEVGWTS